MTLNYFMYISKISGHGFMETLWTENKIDLSAAAGIAEGVECHPIVAALLVSRGITTLEQAAEFLNPSLRTLSSPFALKDMNRAVARITTAIANREKILIFGDFDADGVTATSVLTDFFNHIDAENSWYIPHRINEGYSLKPHHIAMAASRQIDLIITVDCGSDSHEAVRAAAEEDIDVIITDHHEIRGSIPEAVAVVNPKRPDCTAGLNHLAGVGVAFFLVIALRQHLRSLGFWETIEEPNLKTYCDLVALGTIADMVPLTKENRTLSITGITMIQKGLRPAFKAIAQAGKMDISTIDSDDVSYRIAPRINSAGRISHSRICVSLLTSRNPTEAEQTAAILDDLNLKRQQTEQAIINDIETRLTREPDLLNRSSIVLWDPSWNPGVLGIAASRIAKQHNCPVVLISTSKSPATGSCRSIEPYNIHKALQGCSHLLASFGGHVMAAGLSIPHQDLDSFSSAFEQQIRSQFPGEQFQKEICIDAFLDIRDITLSLARQIDCLRPYGSENPEPLFGCRNVTVISSAIIGTRHRKMVIAQYGNKDGASIEAIQFNIDPTDSQPSEFRKIAFKLRINRYNNRQTPQIIIEHTALLA